MGSISECNMIKPYAKASLCIPTYIAIASASSEGLANGRTTLGMRSRDFLESHGSHVLLRRMRIRLDCLTATCQRVHHLGSTGGGSEKSWDIVFDLVST